METCLQHIPRIKPLLCHLQAVWPAGLHYGFPWLAVSNLVTMQSVVFDMPVKGCKTRDNVTVQIDVAIVFRIMGDGAIVSIWLHVLDYFRQCYFLSPNFCPWTPFPYGNVREYAQKHSGGVSGCHSPSRNDGRLLSGTALGDLPA